MNHKHYSVIILSKLFYKDTNAIFRVLTKEGGRISIGAKGVKKMGSKYKSLLCLGSIHNIDLVFYKGDLGFVRSMKTIFYPESLSYEDLVIFEKALSITLSLCPENEPEPEVFQLLTDFIKMFEGTEKKQLYYIAYQCKLLSLLGFIADLHYCIHCEVKFASVPQYFNQVQGFICKGCCNNNTFPLIPFEAIKVLAFIQQYSFENIAKLSLSSNLQIQVASILQIIMGSDHRVL
jgi:DNA repair protein RecO (recombination protein O)